MLNVKNTPSLHLSSSKKQKKSAIKLIEANYQNNTNSDYTEKIAELDKAFRYSDNRDSYWNTPEFSVLYGTPLYEAASHSQKIALNHLSWFGMYNFTANSETQTILYNKITGGVFANVEGYKKMAEVLDLETEQEYAHIHAFRKIGYQTIKTLLGKEAFKEPLKGKLYTSANQGWAETASRYQYYTLRFLANQMFKGEKEYYSEHLKELEEKDKLLPSFSAGFMGEGLAPRTLLRFLSYNWGRSPFLASHYYTLRYMANLGLKHTEHSNSRYYKKLHKSSTPIPIPTAISYYHLLDEAFHTTTSRFMARELYKDFPKPTKYEKLIANLAFYRLQDGMWKGLSAVIPDRHRQDDYSVMSFVYKILRSPIFAMSSSEALFWMEKCFCQEHEGFHQNAKFHQSLLSEFRRTFSNVDYLWDVNREMRVMASGGLINEAIKSNVKTFKRFSQLITAL
jgi:ATP-dependent Clp protease adapter protein ClpS